MSFFTVILFGIPVLDVAFWWWADRRLRSLPIGRTRRGMRLLLTAFMIFQLAFYGWSLYTRIMDWRVPLPPAVPAMGFLWSLFVLPITMIIVTAWLTLRTAARLVLRIRNRITHTGETRTTPVIAPAASAQSSPTPLPSLTRRQLLSAGLAAAPPLFTGMGVARGLSQLSDFRVRRFVLEYPDLPPPLDGLTIAHLSDTHVGRYSSDRQLRNLAEGINLLRPDIVLQTGDLIDFHLADAPAALDMIKRLEAPLGVFMCEGNHDLFDGREGFYSAVHDAGVPLLLNTGRSVSVRGVELRLLGMMWGGSAKRPGANLDENFHLVSRHRRPDAFEILLAHHPHAFDLAADAGIPLTLTGHTHGGQLMLTDRLGAGPMMFRYWSGLYENEDARLIVSNGAGNWFPLRMNAPAEIVHITLRQA